MNLLSFVTVFGLLCVASGLLWKKGDIWGHDQLSVADHEVLRKGSLEVYRRIVERRNFDNVAVAPVDILMLLFKAYVIYNITSMSGFFNSFEPDRHPDTAILKYEGIGRANHIRILELSMGHVGAHRASCHSKPVDGYGFNDTREEIDFSSFENLVLHGERWYRDMNTDALLYRGEFGGRECSIAMGANYFRYRWQQHRRCTMESNFFHTKDTLSSGVKFTHMISDIRYGDLPEVDARYIVLPWRIPEELAANIKLHVILPNSIDGLSQVEAGITDSLLQRMINERSGGSVEVILPEIYVTRKYHPLPLVKNVSEVPNPEQIFDLLTVTKFDIFRASAYDCYLSPKTKNETKFIQRRFIADHPFLILFVQKTPLAKRSLIYGMLAYRIPEQTDN